MIGVEGATLMQEQHVRKISWRSACGKGAPGTEINGFLLFIVKRGCLAYKTTSFFYVIFRVLEFLHLRLPCFIQLVRSKRLLSHLYFSSQRYKHRHMIEN